MGKFHINDSDANKKHVFLYKLRAFGDNVTMLKYVNIFEIFFQINFSLVPTSDIYGLIRQTRKQSHNLQYTKIFTNEKWWKRKKNEPLTTKYDIIEI